MLKGNRLNQIVAMIVFVAALLLVSQQLLSSGEATADGSFENSESPSLIDDVRYSGLPTIFSSELPVEAIEVLERIENGEPHPYRKDGSTFQNREGILPDQQIGHYKEFTVETPGSSDRGARRIVTGQDGERFYTSDHYASFSEVVD